MLPRPSVEATARPSASYAREETMPVSVQLVRDSPPTEMEYDGSVEEGAVETEAVAWVSRLRYDLRVLVLPRASMET